MQKASMLVSHRCFHLSKVDKNIFFKKSSTVSMLRGAAAHIPEIPLPSEHEHAAFKPLVRILLLNLW